MKLTDALATRRGKGSLSVYLAAGHPTTAASRAYLAAAQHAHWIEWGIPFSDPAADGPIIQAATHEALANGITVDEALRMARDSQVPIVAMTYANIAYQRGWDAFAKDLAKNGISGLILPDVPLEESGPIRAALAAHDVAWIPLVTPTTPTKRMQAIAATCTGFLYVVGNVGTTGQANPGALVEATVARAREAAPDTPLAVGFGIATPADVRRVLQAGADAAIVGSHLVNMIDAGATPEALAAEIATLREAAEAS